MNVRILIVRLGALGDLIHAIPAVAAIRRALPDSSIDWLVDVRHRDMLEIVRGLDRRIAIETSRIGSVVAVERDLRRAKYDVALDLQGLLKSGALARGSGATRVIGFPADLLRERAARVFYTETAGHAAPHVIHKNLSMLSALGIRVPDVEFTIEDRNPGIAAEARRRLGIGAGEPFAVLNPGAAWPNKRWPPVYFAEVARGLASRYQLRSLVMWGPAEEQMALDVAAASDGTAAIAPRTTIADLASLLKAARLVISGDTGPMHLAAAMGTPVIGLFGPTDPARNGPWADDDLTASRYHACACHYQRRCRIAGWCMLDIAPREVLELVERRLSAHG